MQDTTQPLNHQQVQQTGLPVCIPWERQINGAWARGGDWKPNKPVGEILLNPARCAALGAPVKQGEEPAGYLYSAKIKTPYRYTPHFSRRHDELDWSNALPVELIARDAGPRK
ncbi:hypothetical protein PSTEL_00480 [Paenibacillus stellifer]|uniref:Uncharacterized protein n=1 Tax=Paenibacillus stellifer TaxID=169760 RepID=A0A089LP11_9BACL|nr:hypothetical protein [Paenibacillus stellifer]AIQ61835.1 hypothetical protein PSTEL_00480 [Paenibacillus stellifer]